MKIRTKALLGIVLSLPVGAAVMVVIAVGSRRLDAAEDMVVMLQEISRGTFDLNSLSGDYLQYHSPRARTQWQRKHKRLDDQLARVRPGTTEEEALLVDLRGIHRGSRELFTELVRLAEGQADAGAGKGQSRELLQRLTAQLSTKLLDTVSVSARLNHLALERVRGIRVRKNRIVFGCVLLLLATSCATSALTMRAVAAPIHRFRRDVRAIGSGDLSHRARISAKDEIGEIASAFNAMTQNLKRLTASRDELEREIAEKERLQTTVNEEREQLLALFDGIDDTIYVADPESYELLYVNPTFRETWGDDVIGKRCHRVLQNRDEPCPFCTNDRIFGEHLGESYVWEFQNEANQRWYRCSDKAIHWSDGRPVRFELAADITDMKDLMARLERSNRELEEFAYVASHDLQEPLRKVSGFGGLLASECGEALPPEGKQYLQWMVDATARMQNLIEDLLALSRVATRGKPFAPVDLAAICRAVVSDLEPHLRSADGRVEVQPLPTLEADPIQMHQLMQNLIGNALKFHKPGETPVVEVWSEPGAERGTRRLCRLFVKDNGIGFDEKFLDRIFTVFKRLHGRDVYEGTGIGLSICRKIVQRHGGRITAQSKPGAGATFIVTLPLKQGRRRGVEP